MVNTTKREKRIAAKRVPFFDLEYAMKYHGYVHEPRVAYASFAKERTNCAVYYQALREGLGMQAKPCAIKCNLCKLVSETNDYIRGTGKAHYPVPANIGYVSLGQDYPGIVYIDDADQDDPITVYLFDCYNVAQTI